MRFKEREALMGRLLRPT